MPGTSRTTSETRAATATDGERADGPTSHRLVRAVSAKWRMDLDFNVYRRIHTLSDCCTTARQVSAHCGGSTDVKCILYHRTICRQLVSDLGPEFQNEILHHLCQMLHVTQLRTTSYRPNCNGRVERVHRTLNNLMAKVVSETQRDWIRHLPACVMAYNV